MITLVMNEVFLFKIMITKLTESVTSIHISSDGLPINITSPDITLVDHNPKVAQDQDDI